jgi:hypothetical protein
VYFSPLGEVFGAVRLLTAPLEDAAFETVERTVTVPAGVAKVGGVLTGFAATDVATAGTVTFDNGGLFAK